MRILLSLFLVLWLPLNSFGAIAFVNADGGNATGSQNSIATAGASLTSGNLNAVCVRIGNGVALVNSVTDTAGNTYTAATRRTFAGAGTTLQFWYTHATAGNASNVVTATLDGLYFFVAVVTVQYSGVAAASPLDADVDSNPAGGGALDPMLSTTFTPAQASEVVLACGDINNAGGSFTAGTGYTIRKQMSGPTQTAVEEQIISSTSALNATMTGSGPNAWGLPAVSFKAAGAATRTMPPAIYGALYKALHPWEAAYTKLNRRYANRADFNR